MKLKLHFDNKTTTFEVDNNSNLLDILNTNHIFLNNMCNGKGSCGKCKIQILNDTYSINEYDKKFFNDEQLQNGFRLACKLNIIKDLEIKLFDCNKEIQSISKYNLLDDLEVLNNKYCKDDYGIAIDIGTTTISFELVNLYNNCTVCTYSALNNQRILGSDIVSRIESSISGKLNDLKIIIEADISDGIKKISQAKNIKKIVIAANTAIIHFLMGFDCAGLSAFPFKPFNLEKLVYTLDNPTKTDITIMPCISSYIGADIASGMLMCNFDKSDNIIMLIDIGTNGEIVLGNKTKILCTSAPAGPAFEGASIEYGIGSIEGAICKIKLKNNKIYYNTINDKPPVGICGSGIIDIVSEALKNNLIDNTGLLNDDFFETGIKISTKPDIYFTQNDFRQVQLAKSAIKSAIEILIESYSCSKNQIKQIYISGGFGYHLNIENAINIGLLPDKFKDKIKIVGNSSLGGAKLYLTNLNSEYRIENIIDVSEEIYLANNTNFNELYLKNMDFTN